HGGDRIYAQAVNMIFLQPEQSAGNQKRADFVAPVVENERAPIAMLTFARVGMLVERGAVEVYQPMRILGKMRGHPIDDDGNAFLMAAVDEVHEILGRSETRSGRKIPDHLIAPGAGKWVLHDGHQLQVRVAHSLQIL